MQTTINTIKTYSLRILYKYRSKIDARNAHNKISRCFNPCKQNRTVLSHYITKLTPSLPCTDTGYLFPSPLDAGELSAVSLNEVTSKFKWILPPFSAKSFPYDLVTSAQSTIPVCGDQRPRVP